MSSYTKATDFASKDALSTGDPLKVVKGTEIDDEFNALQTAVNSKADTNAPALVNPTATTQSQGDNSTKVATTAYTDTAVSNATSASALVNALYPVGSIYINATSSTNPGTLLGHGTWVAFGAGRVPVGIDSGDTDFDTAEETGGAKTHTLTVDEIPAHTHTSGVYGPRAAEGTVNEFATTNSSFGNINTGSTGGGSAHNNLQPYIVVYMWKRTA